MSLARASYLCHMTLDGSDDLNAVLSVLARLSASLETNRAGLEDLCTAADGFGGGAELPVELIQNVSVSSLEAGLHQRAEECAALRRHLEEVSTNVLEAAAMMRELVEREHAQQRAAYERAALELLEWQAKAESAEAEKLAVAIARGRVHARLAEAYSDLSAASLHTTKNN